MNETVEKTAERTEKVSSLESVSHEDKIKEAWEEFELKQCELMRETGIALSEILGNKYYQ